MSNQNHIGSDILLDRSAAKVMAPSEVLAELYDAHAPFVYRNLRRLGVSCDAAEDLTHEVFLVSFRLLGDGVRPEFPRAWLFRQMMHILLNHRRKPKAVEFLEETVPTDSPDFSATLDAKRRVASALSQMPQDLCEVFTLIELEGLTAPEMAQVMGLPVNTVYSKLRRARELFESIVCGETSEKRPMLCLDKGTQSHTATTSTPYVERVSLHAKGLS